MTINKTNKPLSCNPLKIGQPLGGVLALQGIYRSMPIIHGALGCTAFAKTLLTRHYREPIAVQTTALQEMDVIFDADRNLEEALETVLAKHRPDCVGVISTALTEASGADYAGRIKTFKRKRNLRDTLLVTCSLPDYRGSLESGYGAMVESIIDGLLEQTGRKPQRPVKRQVNLLPGSFLTAADVMELKETIASFGLEVIALPDMSTSLSGHLLTGFSPLTRGGVPLDSARQTLRSELTIAIGSSMERPARRLQNAAGIPYRVFDGVSGLAASDEFFYFLQEFSGEPVPWRYRWQRENLLDCMLDAHFNYAGATAVVALEPDHLVSAVSWLEGDGRRLSRSGRLLRDAVFAATVRGNLDRRFGRCRAAGGRGGPLDQQFTRKERGRTLRRGVYGDGVSGPRRAWSLHVPDGGVSRDDGADQQSGQPAHPKGGEPVCA